MLGALEALERGTTAIVDHHASPERDRGLAQRHRGRLRRGRRPGLVLLRGHRPQRPRRHAGRAGRERALPARRRSGLRRRPCLLHALARPRSRPSRAWRPTSGEGCTSTSPRTASTRPPAGGSRASPASDWLLAHCVHLDRPLARDGGAQSPVQHEQRRRLRPPGPPREHGRARDRRHRRGHAGGVPHRLRPPPGGRRDRHAGRRLVVAGSRQRPRSRRRPTTGSAGATSRSIPWHLAFTPGVQPVEVVVGGEVVLRDGRPTRVDPVEVRARAREQAERLWARL